MTLPAHKPNARPPIRWNKDSETARRFYEIKEALEEKYPDRRWTNDAVFTYLVGFVYEIYYPTDRSD